MGESFMQTLRSKWGPLPVWAWFLIFVVIVYFFLSRRSSSQAQQQAQTNAQQGTGTVGSASSTTTPTSNLITTQQPMPIQLPDMTVDSTSPTVGSNTLPNTSSTGGPTAATTQLSSSGASDQLSAGDQTGQPAQGTATQQPQSVSAQANTPPMGQASSVLGA